MSALAGCAGFARLVDVGVCEPSERLVELARGRLRRPWRMRLRLTPWWPGGPPRTLVELTPEQRVPLTARYFDAGNAYLDRLVAAGLRAPAGKRESSAGSKPASAGERILNSLG